MYNVYVKTVKVNCPSSWTSSLAVINKLMHLNVYGIMDVNPVTLRRSYRDVNGALFYSTETTYNGVPRGP